MVCVDESMVAPVFATLIFDVVVGLLESIRRRCREVLRATMRVAPDNPINDQGRFMYQVLRQADMPFTSSNFSGRKTSW